MTPGDGTLLEVGVRHLQRRAAHLLNLINYHQYTELCEVLGGWRNDVWVELAYGHGEPNIGPWGLVRRTHFDFDYHNYVLAQVWDASLPMEERHWEFVLFHNTGENDWVPEQVWSWGDYCPSNGEAGAIVDEIEMLRHER